MKSLITFVGFQGSGKTSASLALVQRGYVPISFADALKDAVAAIFCWDRTLLEGVTAESRVWREQIDPWWSDKLEIPQFSPRWALRNFGTEVMRRHMHEEIWVLNVERRISRIDAPVVLVDARFPNEIALSRRYGGRTFRIKRGADPEWVALATTENGFDRSIPHALGVHESEYAWIDAPIDGVIENNSSIEQLHTKAEQLAIA